jgi:hypothetical protein
LFGVYFKRHLGGNNMMPLGLLSVGETAEVMEVRGVDSSNSYCPKKKAHSHTATPAG